MKVFMATFLVLCAAFTGCKHEDKNQAKPKEAKLPGEAQPRLQTMKLWLGTEEINAELALNDQQRQLGMMFRSSMEENEGMLFVFPFPHQTGFWMKNTSVPLSAAYIDPAGVILEIHNLEPHNTNNVPSISENIQYVLEVPQGWFQRHNVNTGALVRTERGALAEAFTRGVRSGR
jgi:uncharacterized protein